MTRPHSTPWSELTDDRTVLTAHTLSITGTERWYRLNRKGDAYQWQCAQRRNGGYSVHEFGDPQSSIKAAIDLNRINLLLGKGTIVEVRSRLEHEHTVTYAIAPGRVSGEDGAEWSEDIAAEWESIDGELPADIAHVPVWASINGHRLLLLRASDNHLHPVLFDRNEGTFVGLDVIAETFWFSEGGGAPISWSGGSRLSRLCPGMLWSEAWGDVRQAAVIVQATGPLQMGRAVAEFILADEQQFAAAWLLEPFDVSDELDPRESLEWFSLAEEVEMSVTINLESNEELPHCRASLQQNPGYAAVAQALAVPKSEQGERLRTKLEGVRESGVLAGILGYALEEL